MLKWALFGASTIASEWMIQAIRAVGDEVVVVQSSTLSRAKQFATHHHIARYVSSEADLIGMPIDAAYISSTNEKHEAQTVFSAQQGWHVLCEKPISTSLQAARRMLMACQTAGVVFGTNHHLRHNSAHIKMREIVRSGRLGQLVSARVNHAVHLPVHLQGWRIQNREAGGGVVLDIATHNADSLAYVLGEYPTQVQAMLSSGGMAQGLEDQAMSVWRFPSGLTAFTHQAFTHPYARLSFELHGSLGSLHGDGILNQKAEGVLKLHTAQGVSDIALDSTNLYERGLRHFHLAVKGQANDMADGSNGLRSLAVALAVLDSGRSGQVVSPQYGLESAS